MKRFDQINVIPFIDIMLVLLAIVLTTATFISQGLLDVDVPEAGHAHPADNRHTREIAIDADSHFYLDTKPVSLSELKTALKSFTHDTPIVLRVDRKVTFDTFITIIDQLKANQLDHLSIVTRAPQ